MDRSIYYQKYAQAVLKIGLNLQPGQTLVTKMPVEYRDLAIEITKQAFAMGARDVIIDWYDPVVNHYRMLGASVEALSEVQEFEKERTRHFMEMRACTLSPCVFYPDLDLDVPAEKLQAVNQKMRALRQIERDYIDRGEIQWSSFVVGNEAWGEKIYPDLPKEERDDKFFKQVARIVRITEDTDPVENWKKHCDDLKRHSAWLNEQNFDRIHITTGLGTDVEVGLVKGHIWCSAAEMGDSKTVPYCANMPTEEVFTDPDKRRVNGVVYASRPLFLNGRMVENFSVRFEKGRAVECRAEKEQKTLEDQLALDESCRYLGEIALVPFSSPISQMNQCFYFVPLDENAASHMALGTSFPSCVKGGTSMTREELDALGVNFAPIHNDFMYGTPDMKVVGIKEDGTEVLVMENGEFVI